MSTKGKTIVIKLGSSTLMDAEGRLDRAYLRELVACISEIRSRGWNPVVVSSGAIVCGLEVLGFDGRPDDMPTCQAAASVGQNILAQAYADAFSEYDIITSLILITRHTTASRHAYLHARDTLNRLIELGVVPVVNENDTVSVEQIRFGDNDTLAALVACLIDADECVIFSDIEGLYDADPTKVKDAHLLPVVTRITPAIMAAAGGVGSVMGSGGMATKVRAARVLMTAGIPLTICNGRAPQALDDIISGRSVGTRFASTDSRHDITPRKLWIALGDSAKGAIIVDDGAREALIEKGSSLLAVGVSSVEGSFVSDDIVDIMDSSGRLFARGKVSADSDEVALASGRSQRELKENHLLAHMAAKPIVHRDELVVFE